jgi:tungstate transport system substrate-binding protein
MNVLDKEKNNLKKISKLLLVVLLTIISILGCTDIENKVEQNELILATTTSTRDSGLLDHILPYFEEKYNIKVKVIAVGTGKALEMGKNGEADVLLTHAKDSEMDFLKEGHGMKRVEVMYNDFILVGPNSDSLNIKRKYNDDIYKALETIYNQNEYKFISRGDDSGTHKKELKIWNEIGIKPKGNFYIENGSGMADTLKMTDEKQAYTLTDRGTYLSMKNEIELDILVEGNDILFNQYSVTTVNSEKNEYINSEGAKNFQNWFSSKDIQVIIGEYGRAEYGEVLFTPNAK